MEKKEKTIIILGDAIDKGYNVHDVINFLHRNLHKIKFVIGNHESYAYKYLKGKLKKNTSSQEVIETYFNSIKILENDEVLRNKFFEIYENSLNFYVHKNFIATHAPCEKKYLGKIDSESLKKARNFRYPKRRDYGFLFDFIIEFDDKCAFMTKEANDAHPIHIFGHVMSKGVSRFKNKIDIDSGCVAGGELTSVVVNKYRKIAIETVAAGNKVKEHEYDLHKFFL